MDKTGNKKEFFSKKINYIPRQQYIIARLRKSEHKKLRRWLDRREPLEIATHENPDEVWILRRKISEGAPLE